MLNFATIIKKYIWILLAVFACSIQAAEIRWVDRIVVVVNDDIITERDIRDTVENMKKGASKSDATNNNALRQAAIEQLIDKKLVLQIAKSRDIKVSDNEIQQAVEQIAKSQNMTVDQLYKTIEKEGVSKENLHKTIAENIYIDKITSQYKSSIKVSDEEIAQFIQSNNIPTSVVQYEVQHILLKNNKRSDSKVKNELAHIRKQLTQGASFEELAAKYSHDTQSASQGGLIGWISQGSSESSFDEILGSLKVGEVSNPVKSQFGWHLIKLKDTRQTQVSREQQIEFIRSYIIEQKTPHAYQQWLSELRKSAYINYREKPY